VYCAFREEYSNWILADMRYSYGRECIVHLERNSITGYWILADMRYSYGRECIVNLERNRVTGYWLT